jgi:hypothetical protein
MEHTGALRSLPACGQQKAELEVFQFSIPLVHEHAACRTQQIVSNGHAVAILAKLLRVVGQWLGDVCKTTILLAFPSHLCGWG